jgi:hypothetical protein
MTSFDVRLHPRSEISDFKILSNNLLMTLSFGGYLNVYVVDVYKHESNLVHSFKIEGTEQLVETEREKEEFYCMSYAAHTNTVAVLTRTEITRRRGWIHLIKLSFLEKTYE